MSRVGIRIAKLTAVTLGWLVVVATSYSYDPVESTEVDVDLAIGPAAPSTAVVDVTFEGAFVDEENAVCVFVREEHGDYPSSDIGVEIQTLQRLGATTVAFSGGWLQLGSRPPTWRFVDSHVCAFITCGAEEPCGGRFAFTLVDDAAPDAGADATRLDPIALFIAAMTKAAPGALPGRASITLVETLP